MVGMGILDKEATQNDLQSGSSSPGETGQPKSCDFESETEGSTLPSDGLLFVLPYLDLHSRVRVEAVNKTLKEAIRENPLVWQHINVGNYMIPNFNAHTLLTLVKRADGHLKSLMVMRSIWFNEELLEQILELSPGLEKLFVPWCAKIRAAAFVRLVESHAVKARVKGFPGIKQVRVRGLSDMTGEQLEHLQRVLEPATKGRFADRSIQLQTPQYYGHEAESDTQTFDTPPVDVGLCPLCHKVRVVYDCKRHSSEKDATRSFCQGCIWCISRCEECGCCIMQQGREEDYMGTVCCLFICVDCWRKFLKCSICNRAVCTRHTSRLIADGAKTFTCRDCLKATAEGQTTKRPSFHLTFGCRNLAGIHWQSPDSRP